MKRLENLFATKKNNVLNVYCTAGFPQLNSTLEIMQALQNNGADIIELGMPYSDPLADGVVIQHSSSIALANGMTIPVLFEQLNHFRKDIRIPVILMGYMNPVLQYGFEKFCADAAAVGIDGVILPDLPMYEYETTYGQVLKQYELDFIFLITPETTEERIRKLDSLSSGFLYAVMSSSTTGGNNNLEDSSAYLQRIAGYQLTNPILAGFGIKDKDTFKAACQYCTGAIIGTAYIKLLETSADTGLVTQNFLNSILK